MYMYQMQLADLKKIPPEQRAKMIEAIHKEIGGLCELGTFELVRMPHNQRGKICIAYYPLPHHAPGGVQDAWCTYSPARLFWCNFS